MAAEVPPTPLAAQPHRTRGFVRDLVLQKPQSTTAQSDRPPWYGMDSDNDDEFTSDPPAAVMGFAQEPEEADDGAPAGAMPSDGYTPDLINHLENWAKKTDGEQDLLHDLQGFPACAVQLQETLKVLRARTREFCMECLSSERNRIKDLIWPAASALKVPKRLPTRYVCSCDYATSLELAEKSRPTLRKRYRRCSFESPLAEGALVGQQAVNQPKAESDQQAVKQLIEESTKAHLRKISAGQAKGPAAAFLHPGVRDP